MIQGPSRRSTAMLPTMFRAVFSPLLILGTLMLIAGPVFAADDVASNQADAPLNPQLKLVELVRTGGVVGGVIFALSLSMVYLIVEHLLSIRRRALIPADLAESVHQLLTVGRFEEARQLCRDKRCYLGNVLDSGLSVIELGYRDVEKVMEDTATEQAARLFRKIEYLHLIGTLSPMLGLLGTVYGMIQAFMEFEAKANPAVSELAPGIYRALVTTMLGLTVAVPAFASFAIFRNRIDELVAEASLTAEHVFADFRREQARRQKSKSRSADRPARLELPEEEPPRFPSVAIERESKK